MDKTAVASRPGRRSKHPRRPRRLLLFVHYNKWGNLADYVVHLLKKAHKLYSRVVFISNSPVSQKDLARLQGLHDDFFQRENTGFDFLAWKEALEREGQQALAGYDSVTLMNDTCFGPLFNLADVYREMEAREVDFWGLTNHAQMTVDNDHPLADNGMIPEHLQSYFLCFHRTALQSDAFHTFWKKVAEEKTLVDVIRKYETKLTAALKNVGLRYAAVCDTIKLDHRVFDKARLEPEILLEQQVPFIKIKAFFSWSAPQNAFLLSLVRRHSKYPLSLIQSHFKNHFSPETSLQVCGHSLDEIKISRNKGQSGRIALHIHAFYVDILRKILNCVNHRVRTPVDLFLTTDTQEKAEEIESLLRREFPHLKVRKLLICENRGRDIGPWLQIAPMMASYDFAGHLHTKKAPTANTRFGYLWTEELLDSLLGHFSQIRNAFTADPTLGIVIPDIPSIFKFPPHRVDYTSDTVGQRLLEDTWERLGCDRPIDFATMKMLVFPYGNMFWYRPKALEPLWKTHWDPADIPEEPVPTSGTLLHALERLTVYVAWAQGYSFCVVSPTQWQPAGFQNELAFCEYPALTPTAPRDKPRKPSTLQLLHSKMRKRLTAKKP